jgi:hypothetical protein
MKELQAFKKERLERYNIAYNNKTRMRMKIYKIKYKNLKWLIVY